MSLFVAEVSSLVLTTTVSEAPAARPEPIGWRALVSVASVVGARQRRAGHWPATGSNRPRAPLPIVMSTLPQNPAVSLP